MMIIIVSPHPKDILKKMLLIPAIDLKQGKCVRLLQGQEEEQTIYSNDPVSQALEFQKVVDRLFSFNGFRGEDDDSPIQLTRRFRELAGFSDDEIDEIADMSREARVEAAS
mgnify:CR=1 FL=1